MGRSKKADSQVKTDEFFDDLVKDTAFTTAASGSLMHSRMKVKTPLEVLNCIYGGGIPLGILSEISGNPGSGKSTFLYQCMARFQEDYPDGVPIILDMEASMDNDRLETLGIDTTKVLRLPSTSLEHAFSNVFKILTKLEKALETKPNLSVFLVYDSLAAGGTDKQQEEISKGNDAFGAGAMMMPQRIIKQNLANILPYMEKYPIFVGLINQVFTQLNSYGYASVSSGGGFGLRHLCHAHISFSEPKDEYEGSFLVGTSSMMQLKKSKLSPKMIDIPCYIDVTRGGKIDEEKSFARYISSKSVGFLNTEAWYSFSDSLKLLLANAFPTLKDNKEFVAVMDKKFRKDELPNLLREDKDLYLILQIALIEFLDNIYPAQRDINSEYQEQLKSNCAYLKS